MIPFPVYRPEITVYHRGPDGGWDTTYGPQTATLFAPMADEDGSALTEGGFRRFVRLGSEPFFTILTPDGSELLERGRALFLRTPRDRALDAVTALAYAKRRDRGLDLARPGLIARPVAPPSPDPFAGVPARAHAPSLIPPDRGPARDRPAARQLSLFGEGGAA